MAKLLPGLGGPGNRGLEPSGPAAKWMGALCYLNVLILIPACSKWRSDEFVRFNLNQGAVLLAGAAVSGLLALLPVTAEFGFWLTLLVDALSLVGLVNVLRAKAVPLPVVGRLAENFKLF